MEHRKSWQIPSFGNWDYGDEMPITQYFESARQAGLVKTGFSGGRCEEEFFDVPVAMPVKLAYQDDIYRPKVRKMSDCSSKEQQKQQSKQKRASLPKAMATPKAVDEDLYKIPPDLLYQKPKKKRMLRTLFSECLGLNCIACA